MPGSRRGAAYVRLSADCPPASSPVHRKEYGMRLSTRLRTRLALATAAGTVMATTAAVLTAHTATAGCSVSYTVPAQWPGGFTANMSVTNLGDPINGWTLTW